MLEEVPVGRAVRRPGEAKAIRKVLQLLLEHVAKFFLHNIHNRQLRFVPTIYHGLTTAFEAGGYAVDVLRRRYTHSDGIRLTAFAIKPDFRGYEALLCKVR